MRKRSKLFVLPALTIYSVFMIVPIIIVFISSFTNWDGISQKFKFIGLKNFMDIPTDDRFISTIQTTLLITIVVVIATNVLGLIFAILLNRAKAMTNIYRSIFFLPVLLSSVAIAFSWNGILSYTGILNNFLSSIGLGRFVQDWFGNKSNAIASICTVEIWRSMGFCMVIYLASLQTVPKDLYEACIIDGGNEWDKFKSVTLPMIVPGITINCILSIMNGLKLFDTPMILTNGGPGFDTDTIVLTIFKRALGTSEFGYASALSFVLFITIVLITLIQLKLAKKAEGEN
jgi:ABC-type sugar transport system permease subunit